MERRKKALLIAFVLGDGYLKVDKRSKNKSTALKICHSIKQKEYIEHKAFLLGSLIGGRKPKINEYRCKLSNGKVYKQLRFERTHKYFRVLHKWMYPDKYNPKFLHYLTPEALAIWYMDDGSIVANNRYEDGTCRSARTNIHTCCESLQQAKQICEYFKEYWNIKFTPFNEKGKYSIRCFHKEGEKFHKLIHPYIIQSMSYKQRFYYDKSA